MAPLQTKVLLNNDEVLFVKLSVDELCAVIDDARESGRSTVSLIGRGDRLHGVQLDRIVRWEAI